MKSEKFEDLFANIMPVSSPQLKQFPSYDIMQVQTTHELTSNGYSDELEMEQEILKGNLMTKDLTEQFKKMFNMKPILSHEINSKKISCPLCKKLTNHTIVFDLDETLIFSIPDFCNMAIKPFYQKISFLNKSLKKSENIFVIKRPYLDVLLQTLSNHYELMVHF